MNLPRLLSQWYRLIRGALVLACILVLLVILLGRLLVPQVSTLTPQLLSLLEANTDLYWEIEGLSGEWQHLKPIIRIESLTARLAVISLRLAIFSRHPIDERSGTAD